LVAVWLFIAILVAIAFVPSVIYAIWIRNTEKYAPEPWGRIAAAFFWGAVFAVIIALILSVILIWAYEVNFERPYEFLRENPSAKFLILACVIAPLAEEFAKGIGVYVAGRELDELEDGLIYGAVVGLGFAATENLLYEYSALASAGIGAFLLTAIFRTLTSTLLHASATAATGYGIARSKLLGSRLSIVGFYLLAVLMHGAFNFFASGVFVNECLALVLVLFFSGFAIRAIRAKIRRLDRGF